MIEHLVQHLNQYAELTEEEATFLEEYVPVKTYKKGDFLLKQGQISNAFFYIVEGCVRLFYEVGEEETHRIFLY